MNIAQFEALILNVSEKTNWFFIRVTAENGMTGLGEASLNGWETAQLAVADNLRTAVQGKSLDAVMPLLRVYPHSPGGLVASSVASATEQAVTDLRAKLAGVPVHQLLSGKAARKAVPVYANINRGARDRSPAGIALAAGNAVAAGYTAVKIAPFDGVYPDHPDAAELKRLTRLGIERIYAIRAAVGPDIGIMVDCHWRFDEPGTLQLIHELQAAKLYWLECPVSENPDGFAAISRIHAETARSGMKLAGAERQVAAAGFKPFVADGLLDVVMPDIKYAGGYAEMLNIAALCAAHDTGFSPHNPSGPVCNMASIQLCAVAPAFLILEYQLAESPLYFDVVGGFRPKLVNGCFEVPDTPGIGIELDDAVLRAHPYRALAANANLDPRLG
ncbi:MAG: mandelate racemase/muconate lactonizing enzyme family protein [Burkholderiales bacterium]|nr:mandelate racemase/muconate lactonizing enzyme family protein [Burkholderiales bacterium]